LKENDITYVIKGNSKKVDKNSIKLDVLAPEATGYAHRFMANLVMHLWCNAFNARAEIF